MELSRQFPRHIAAPSNSGLWHATLGEVDKSLCGVDVNHEYDRPTALLDEDPYNRPAQIIECTKCEKAMRKSRISQNR
jgi:hypothetical protein